MTLKVVLIIDGEIIMYSETRSDVSNALGYLYQVGLDVKFIENNQSAKLPAFM